MSPLELIEPIDPTAGIALQYLSMSESEQKAYWLGVQVGCLTESQRAMIVGDLDQLFESIR